MRVKKVIVEQFEAFLSNFTVISIILGFFTKLPMRWFDIIIVSSTG